MLSPAPRPRLLLLLGILTAAAVAIFLHGPIAQPQAYHHFADARSLLGIPNVGNVVSNLPFLLVGLFGLRELARQPADATRPAYLAFYVGAVLVAFGSAAYHWAPSDATLVWDRLPMTLSFAGIVAIVAGESGTARPSRVVLPLMIVAGIGSVAWWSGTGDLRPYVAVQFLPMLGIPLALLLFRLPRYRARYLVIALACYALAKILEDADRELFAALGGTGGHALKHLAAAAGMFSIAIGMKKRLA